MAWSAQATVPTCKWCQPLYRAKSKACFGYPYKENRNTECYTTPKRM